MPPCGVSILGDGRHAVLADTVGFIRELPHDLVAAFRSTLQETDEAALLLHVVDASDPERDAYIETVNKVLDEIGADESAADRSVQQDRPAPASRRGWNVDPTARCAVFGLSAQTGAGLDALCREISARLQSDTVRGWLKLGPPHARARAALFRSRCRAQREG